MRLLIAGQHRARKCAPPGSRRSSVDGASRVLEERSSGRRDGGLHVRPAARTAAVFAGVGGSAAVGGRGVAPVSRSSSAAGWNWRARGARPRALGLGVGPPRDGVDEPI